MIETLPQPIVFAHRGASAYAPENTLAAFHLALAQGAPAIEFDVKLSADGEVVVIHDQTVDRTTNASGNVAHLPFDALRKLDAGFWFGAGFRGEKIPSLHEVFAAFGDVLLMNVELTNYATPFDALIPKVVDLVKRYGVEKHVWFSSFSPHNLMRTAQLLPVVPRAQLIWPGPLGAWQRTWGRVINIQAEHPWKDDISAETVQAAHRRKRRIHAWTVNTPEDMRRLTTLGLDGFFTDDPLTALEIVNPKSAIQNRK
jgi:glycerophosphoryl diester phosphodiesterase